MEHVFLLNQNFLQILDVKNGTGIIKYAKNAHSDGYSAKMELAFQLRTTVLQMPLMVAARNATKDINYGMEFANWHQIKVLLTLDVKRGTGIIRDVWSAQIVGFLVWQEFVFLSMIIVSYLTELDNVHPVTRVIA